jgi:hypothetical protein
MQRKGCAVFDTMIDTSEKWFLRYECVDSAQGRLLVLMSDAGVVDVIRGETLAYMLWQARGRLPGMAFVPDRGRHQEWVSAVVKRLERRCECGVVPLDLGCGYQSRSAG